jgi:hypothetical protein
MQTKSANTPRGAKLAPTEKEGIHPKAEIWSLRSEHFVFNEDEKK